MNENSIFSLQNIEESILNKSPCREAGPKGSILRNSSKGVISSQYLDPNNSSCNMRKKASFKENLVEIREVESFKDFNYENSYNIDESQCKCDCLLI